MRKKVKVIFLCMLVIATALPAVGTINEKEIEENQATLKVQTQLFQEIDYNNLLVNPLNFDDEYRNHPFSSHPPLYPRFNILKGNTDENSIVCGYVIDQETSLPIENAEVDLNWRDNQGNYDWNYTYTTATGFYSMNVAAGEISLYVYASGYLYDETDWNEIAEYETMWVNFSLYPVPPENSVVCGYVQDSDTSLPIEFAGINLNWRDDQGHNLYNYSYTNSAGFYSMNVAAGEIELYVYVSGYFSESTGWYEIDDYDLLWMNFSLDPVPPENSVVCGYVQDSDTSLPIESADISLYWHDDQGHNLYNNSYTNSAGFYSMNVAAGEIAIIVRYTGYAFESTGWINVVEYQTLWLNFSLEPDTTPPIITNISLPDYVGNNHPGDISVDVSDDHLLDVEMILADIANITNHLMIWYYYDLTGMSGTCAVRDYEGSYGAIDQGAQSVPTTVLMLINWTKADALFTLAFFKKNQTASEQELLVEFEKSTGHLTNIAAITSYGYIPTFEYITDMIEPGVSIISPLAFDADFDMIYDPDLTYTLYSIGDLNNPSLSWHPLFSGTYQGMIAATDRAFNVNTTSFNLTVFQTEPCLEITTIRGGLGVTAVINNTGDGDAVKEPVSITVTGGLLGLINKTVTKEVDLKAGESTEIQTGMIFGLGSINIAVTTPNDDETKTGTQIIIFTLVK